MTLGDSFIGPDAADVPQILIVDDERANLEALELTLATTGCRVVRAQSAFGFSMIYVVFEDPVDQYFARSRVLERLSLVATQMPEGAVPTLGPDATGVGHVFWYTVESDRHSLRDLRTLQDWIVS